MTAIPRSSARGSTKRDVEGGAPVADAHFTRNQTRAEVIDYIKRLYNLRRRNSMLDYLSPLEFEETLAR